MTDKRKQVAAIRTRVPEKYVAQLQYRKTLQWAEQLVHEAMLLGLEWAQNSPRAFANDAMIMRYHPGGGADLTEVECKAIKEVTLRLHYRLQKSSGLWRARKGAPGKAKMRMTDEEMAAEVEREAIALGARPRR